jgi:hypothetical protein
MGNITTLSEPSSSVVSTKLSTFDGLKRPPAMKAEINTTLISSISEESHERFKPYENGLQERADTKRLLSVGLFNLTREIDVLKLVGSCDDVLTHGLSLPPTGKAKRGGPAFHQTTDNITFSSSCLYSLKPTFMRRMRWRILPRFLEKREIVIASSVRRECRLYSRQYG